MANTKSARKRVLTTQRNRQRNRAGKSLLRSQVKKFRSAVQSGDVAMAGELLREAHATIDKTAKKGIIHERTASRYKSRLALAHRRLAAAQEA